jgi:predicted phosphodiesterase
MSRRVYGELIRRWCIPRRRSAGYIAAILLALTSACGAPPSPQAQPRTRLTPAVRVVAANSVAAGAVTLPVKLASVKFAVIGDSGRGTPPQHEVAAQMVRFRDSFSFVFVVMLGDNIYEGPATADDYRRKFEEPYRALLDAGVKFYAVLGNHDDPRQVDYAPFNMNGERYYSFAPPVDLVTKIASRVEFFAVDSSNLDRQQLQWLDERLAASTAEWKIVLLHHPLYTSGRYRNASRAHRWALEPLLVKNGVDAVFSGHEHIYQRSELQNGIQYFVSGAAGSLRLGDGVAAPYIARSYDTDYHFMLVEIDGDDLHFQAISRSGETIDAGTLFQDGEEARVTASAGTAPPH